MNEIGQSCENLVFFLREKREKGWMAIGLPHKAKKDFVGSGKDGCLAGKGRGLFGKS